MELRQLEYLIAVAEDGSFTRAAERLHVAQPGVSAQVRKLERELGQELLDRSGRAVRLTAAGEAVLPYARAALAAVAGARLAVDELAGLVRGRVAIGTVGAISSFDLADLLAGFHREHPTVDITLWEAGSDRLLEALRAGLVDVAFVSLGRADPPAGIGTLVVADEALVVAGGDEAPVALESLRDRALICLPRGTGLRSLLDEACAAAGFRPRIAFEAGDPHVVARMAARGLGLAVLPAAVASAHAGELRSAPLVEPELRGRLLLAWRTDGPISPAARALLRSASAWARPIPRCGGSA
jgi:DNA-binding transcriptional LysR family regulator